MKSQVYSAVLYGWLIVFSLIMITSMILAIFLRFTNLGETQLSWLTFSAGMIILFIGGVFAGLKGKTKGWMIGLCIGLGFTLIVFFIQYLGYKQAFTFEQLLYHIGYLIAAMVGGVLGVNFVTTD